MYCRPYNNNQLDTSVILRKDFGDILGQHLGTFMMMELTKNIIQTVYLAL